LDGFERRDLDGQGRAAPVPISSVGSSNESVLQLGISSFSVTVGDAWSKPSRPA
jgi:hypothetical protein